MSSGAEAGIELDLLGVTYRFSSNSPRWVGFMQQMWEPFLVEVDEPTFTFELRDVGGFELHLPEHHPLVLDDVWEAVNSIKYSLVDHALRRATTVLAIHASLVEKEGARALLVGASEAGKTTLCLELLDRSWRYGSDDMAPLLAGDGRVLSFPRALAVRDLEVWDRYFDSWRPPEWLPVPRGPFQLPSSLFEMMGPGPLEATHIFFIDPDHSADSAAVPLSRALATAQLSQYVRWFGSHDLGSLAKLARRARAWRVTYRNPREGADQVEAACFGG